MQAFFYNLDKRNASTLQPSRSNGVEIDIDLKSNCSILTPILELRTPDYPSYNYVEIPSFSRFYYINNKEWSEGFWELSCEVDIGASLKADILNTRANIMYCMSNRNIIDQRIPLLSSPTITHAETVAGPLIGPKAVCISVTGKGSFGHYVLANAYDLDELIDGIDSTTTDWKNLLDAAKQAAYGGNAADNIKSCIVFPVQLKTEGLGANEPLYLGGYPAKKSGGAAIEVLKINDAIQEWDGSISIPWHFSDWRRNPPYSKIFMYLPLIGTLELESSSLVGESTIAWRYSFNITTGEMAYEIKSGSGRILNTGNNSIAMDGLYGNAGINTAKAFVSGGGLAAGAAALAAGLATGGMGTAAALGIAGGMASAAGGLINALGGTSQGSSGIGGGAVTGLNKLVHIWVISRDITDTGANYSPIMGYPYMKIDKVGNHSGYVQTEGAQVGGTFSAEERNRANALLNGGVYIE